MTGNIDGARLSECIEFNPETGGYHVECDWRTDESLSETVVAAVAAISDSDVTDLTPLNSVVDPDALDAIFSPTGEGTPREGGHLSFVFEGHEVTVHRYGSVVVHPPGREWSGLRHLPGDGAAADPDA